MRQKEKRKFGVRNYCLGEIQLLWTNLCLLRVFSRNGIEQHNKNDRFAEPLNSAFQSAGKGTRKKNNTNNGQQHNTRNHSPKRTSENVSKQLEHGREAVNNDNHI